MGNMKYKGSEYTCLSREDVSGNQLWLRRRVHAKLGAHPRDFIIW